MKTRKLIVAAVNLFISLSFHPAFGQGSLTPPGAPAPAMKSLSQIEPRTPISSLPYSITTAGSYYLTTNLTGGASQYGILVMADNVTLDLNGFSLIGVNNAFEGIAFFSQKDLRIRNGTVRGWPQGGIDASIASGSRFENLFVADNGSAGGSGGIAAGANSLVLQCTASSNSFFGISVGNGSTVRDCNTSGNAGKGIISLDSCKLENCAALSNTSTGIVAGVGCILKECAAKDNLSTGMGVGNASSVEHCTTTGNSGYGIRAGISSTLQGVTALSNSGLAFYVRTNCTVRDCAASSNGGGFEAEDDCAITGCVARTNSGGGFFLGSGGTIKSCTASYSGGVGIQIDAFCVVSDCSVSFNASHGILCGSATALLNNVVVNNSGDGINIDSGGCRCEANNIFLNTGHGITVQTAGHSIIIKNNATGNTAGNYNIPAGNDLGPIGTATASTSPWANFSN